MAATIILQTPGGVDDKRIRLANAQFARPFSVGSWSKIRIFVRWAVGDNSNMMSGVTNFMFGLCSGSTNLPGDATTQHAIGAGTNGDWDGASSSTYYGFGTTFNFLSRIGATLTALGGGVAATSAGVRRGLPATRTLFFIDFTKGSPSWTGQVMMIANTSSTTTDVDYATMMTYAELETPGALAGHIVGSTARTFAVDEGTNGTLDHVCFWWPRTDPVVEISDIGIVRFA